MIATRLTLRDFRCYEAADVRLGPGLTVVAGRNGAGKTNLLEAIYFACTGRSCRTANEREVVRFGAELTRLELQCEDALGRHDITVGFKPGDPKRLTADGAAVERLTGVESRPLVAVFLPDRLELVLGRAVAAPGAPGPGRRRPVAEPRRHPARVLGRARPAQRAAGLDPRRPRLTRFAAGLGRRAGTPRHRADGRPGGDRRAAAAALRRARRGARAGGRGRAALQAALEGRPIPRRSPPSSPSASTPTSSAASPATARTATISPSAARAASCAPTARAASSASACWRCCWPSARSWAPSAGARRCCCSTT